MFCHNQETSRQRALLSGLRAKTRPVPLRSALPVVWNCQTVRILHRLW